MVNRQNELDNLGQGLMMSVNEFIGLIIYIPRKYIDNNDLDIITDGKIIKVGNKFFECNVKQQAYKLLHVICNVALRHTRRAFELGSNANLLAIWSLSCSVIISEVLNHYCQKETIECPPNTFTKKIYEEVFRYDSTIDTAEKVFKVLVDNTKIMKGTKGGFDNNTLSPNEFPDSDQTLTDNGLGSEVNDMDDNMRDTIWSKRIESSLAGTDSSNSICRLLQHLRKVKTPWQSILKTYLLSRLKPECETNWRRPSRRVLAGVTKIFEPARSRKRGIRKLALMIDLSGSCWDKEIFTEFVSHIDKVISISGAETKIFTFDTEVQNEIILPLRTKLSTLLTSESVQITGGGGTDFIPVIQAVEQYNPDVAVGFTDCYGPFTPQQPTGIPFIWATPKLAAKAPWGKQLTLSSD